MQGRLARPSSVFWAPNVPYARHLDEGLRNLPQALRDAKVPALHARKAGGAIIYALGCE